MEDFDDTPGEMPVEFDMSFNTNSRINYLLWKCNQSSEQNDPDAWYQTVKNIYKELSVKMHDGELEENENLRAIGSKQLNEYLQYNANYERNHDKMPNYNPPAQIFETLFDWEMGLRKKAQKIGLIFKEGRDPRNAIQ